VLKRLMMNTVREKVGGSQLSVESEQVSGDSEQLSVDSNQ
jgi:hypothetical protein